jgi:hypothetical protein
MWKDRDDYPPHPDERPMDDYAVSVQNGLTGEHDGKFNEICMQFAKFLNEKNRRYGNSVLKPLGVFTKHINLDRSNAFNGMLYRLDDKLARIKNAGHLRKNDLADIVGYILPLMMEMGYNDLEDLID